MNNMIKDINEHLKDGCKIGIITIKETKDQYITGWVEKDETRTENKYRKEAEKWNIRPIGYAQPDIIEAMYYIIEHQKEKF